LLGLGIRLMVLGVVFIGLGYAIRFNGKYDLINDFTADRAAGILDDEYAKGVGSIEFVGGIAMIPLGVVAILLEEIPGATCYIPILQTTSPSIMRPSSSKPYAAKVLLDAVLSGSYDEKHKFASPRYFDLTFTMARLRISLPIPLP